ncbi:hypothetical protein LCGC14_2809190, partial [marine sediment metagenome]
IGQSDQLLLDEIDKILRKSNLFMLKYNHKDALFMCLLAYLLVFPQHIGI